MNELEKEQITNIPEKYRPLDMWSYFGYFILFEIPVVGLVCMIIFAITDSNIARRNFARGMLLVNALLAAVCLIVSLIFLFVPGLLESLYDALIRFMMYYPAP
ncbi:MAG: ABC transporter permease [Clostridia bacterium]|nr:ABC transporter permease [Clostridia bacterium]